MREFAKPDSTLSKILPPQELILNKNYVKSQFVIPYSNKGRWFVYNNLTCQIWELDQPLKDQYKASSIEMDCDLTRLMQGYFLVPEGKNECQFYENLFNVLRTLRKPKGIKVYTILPTLACNARCVYCYEEGMPQKTMTYEIVEQTVQYILKTKDDGIIELGWFGGEPLLGESIIDSICKKLRSAGVKYTSHIITNGSLLSKAMVDKIVDFWNVSRVQISMDGAESDYIARKRYLVYQDYYNSVMKAVNLLTSRNIIVSIRCNVDEKNIDSIQQVISDLSAMINDKDKVCIYLAPLYSVRTGKDDLYMWKRVFDAEMLIKAAGFNLGSHKSGGVIPRIHHCMADAGNVVISPDGKLFSCEHCTSNSKFGDVISGIIDEKARLEFCRIDRTRDMCRKCPFLPDCTSFATCPVKNTHCKEKMMMQFEYSMKRLVVSSEVPEQINPVC